MNIENSTVHSEPSILSTNKVLKNTYLLLSATLLFSAMTAGLSMYLNLPHFGMLITFGGYFGLLFLTTKFSQSSLGILFVFALTFKSLERSWI